MISKKKLKLESILGLWESENYTLVITPESAVLTKKIEDKSSETEPIIWHHIIEKENIKHYNTIQLSKYIYIHQLLDDDLKEIIIRYNDVNYHFHRVNFINSFKFYKSPKDVEKFVAIRWHSPWKYVAMIEFQGFKIKRILKGESKEEQDEIRHCYLEEILPENWSELNFETYFPDYRQINIINKIKNEIQY